MAEKKYYALTAIGNDPRMESKFSSELFISFVKPTGLTFVDSFDTNTITDYNIVRTGGTTVTYDNARMNIINEDNNKVEIYRLLPQVETFDFSFTFHPYQKFPLGGRIKLILIAVDGRYVEILKNDGYNNGAITEGTLPFTTNYTQNQTYIIKLKLSDGKLDIDWNNDHSIDRI